MRCAHGTVTAPWHLLLHANPLVTAARDTLFASHAFRVESVVLCPWCRWTDCACNASRLRNCENCVPVRPVMCTCDPQSTHLSQGHTAAGHSTPVRCRHTVHRVLVAETHRCMQARTYLRSAEGRVLRTVMTVEHLAHDYALQTVSNTASRPD